MQQAWSNFLTSGSWRDQGLGARGGASVGERWQEPQVLPGGKVRCLKEDKGDPE